MSEKTKVLAAMIALDEFTTDQLCRFADVKPATAAGVLGRNKTLVHEIGTMATGKRGGQPIRYRLTEEGRAAAQSQLEQAFASFGKGGSSPLSTIFAYFAANPAIDSPSVDPPLGIEAADDTLSRLLPEAASTDERLELLAVAEREARSALQELDDSPDALRIRSMVDDRLARVNAERTAIHEHRDVAVLNDLTASRKVLQRMLRGLVQRIRRPRPLRALRVQIWSLAAEAEAIQLRTKIAQTLEQRAEILVTDVPSNPEHVLQLGDAVILLVDSRQLSAVDQFQRALAACRSLLRPLVVLDQDYSPGFRNLVLGSGVADYRNDAASLDQAGIATVIEQATFSPLLPIRSPRIAVAQEPIVETIPLAGPSRSAAPAAAISPGAAISTPIRVD